MAHLMLWSCGTWLLPAFPKLFPIFVLPQDTDNCSVLRSAPPSTLLPPPFLPIALPRVPHIGVVDAVLICLLIQEIEHILDGQRERAAAVHRAEQRLKQVVHEFLQRSLMGAASEKVKGGMGARLAKLRWQEGTPDGVPAPHSPAECHYGPPGISKAGGFTNADCAAGGPQGTLQPAATHSCTYSLFLT